MLSLAQHCYKTKKSPPTNKSMIMGGNVPVKTWACPHHHDRNLINEDFSIPFEYLSNDL